MMWKTFPALALAGAMVLGPLELAAQVTPPRGGQRQRLELERRLQLRFQRTVQEQLSLDAGGIQRLQGVLRTFQEERSELARAQASLRHRLRDPALPQLGEEQARALIREMVELQERELELYKREQAELLAILSPVQLLRFYGLREELGRRVQELRRGRGGGILREGVGGALSPPYGGGGGARRLP